MNLAARIRGALRDGRPCSIMDVADRLGLQKYGDVERVRHAMLDMATRGVLTRVEREPLYRLAEGQKRGEKQARIWKAVMIRGAKGCTAKEAAALAAADLDYVKRYLRWLRSEGWVREISTGVHERGNVYRVAPDRGQLAAPQWNRRKEDKRRRHGQESAGIGEAAAERGAGE